MWPGIPHNVAVVFHSQHPKGHVVLSDKASEVKQCHFHPILLIEAITEVCQVQGGHRFPPREGGVSTFHCKESMWDRV